MKPKKFSATFITKTFYPGWKPAVINCGECYSWAYCALKVFPNSGIELCNTENNEHAFIKIGNLFYDSESVRGVKDWRQLHCITFMARGSKYLMRAQKYSLSKYKSLWNNKDHWKKLDNLIKEKIK